MIRTSYKLLNCNWFTWLTAGPACKRFTLTLTLWVVLCIFSADSLSAARRWESEGQDKTRPIQLAFARDSRQGGTDPGRWKQREKVSWVFQLPVLFLILIYFLGYFCSGVSGPSVTQRQFPVPKQVLKSVLWCRICLFFIPTPSMVYLSHLRSLRIILGFKHLIYYL